MLAFPSFELLIFFDPTQNFVQFKVKMMSLQYFKSRLCVFEFCKMKMIIRRKTKSKN